MSGTIKIVFPPNEYSPATGGSIINSRTLANLNLVSLCRKGKLGKAIAVKREADTESAVKYRTEFEKFCHSGNTEIFFYRLLLNMELRKALPCEFDRNSLGTALFHHPC